MFSSEYCQIFKNTYFEEHLLTAASDLGLRTREPHLQSHVKYRSRGQVSSQNVSSPHLQGPWSPKLVRC